MQFLLDTLKEVNNYTPPPPCSVLLSAMNVKDFSAAISESYKRPIDLHSRWMEVVHTQITEQQDLVSALKVWIDYIVEQNFLCRDISLHDNSLVVTVEYLSVIDPLMPGSSENPVNVAISYYTEILLRLWYIVSKTSNCDFIKDIGFMIFVEDDDDDYYDDDESSESDDVLIAVIRSFRGSFRKHVIPHISELEDYWDFRDPSSCSSPPSISEIIGFYAEQAVIHPATKQTFFPLSYLKDSDDLEEDILMGNLTELGMGDPYLEMEMMSHVMDGERTGPKKMPKPKQKRKKNGPSKKRRLQRKRK
ncbi:hypothetical protein GEMRC1_001184 [Eukaryota sp. GEM-RC1]